MRKIRTSRLKWTSEAHVDQNGKRQIFTIGATFPSTQNEAKLGEVAEIVTEKAHRNLQDKIIMSIKKTEILTIKALGVSYRRSSQNFRCSFFIRHSFDNFFHS
jgi:hypothetical protein